MPSPRRPRSLVAVTLAAALLLALRAEAQPTGVIIRATPGGPPPGFQPMRGPQPSPQAAQPKEENKDDASDEDKKDGEKPDEEKEEEESEEDKPLTRPDKPPTPPDPRELEAKPDASGRVTFSFHGQAWPDVLQWLANVSELSLDWRELPKDYLNLTTQRAYTLPEARDLINRHLQARGYALLLSGEVLSVFKLDQLDPSLVPRVSEDGLYDRLPHDIVKVSLDVPEGLDPKQAVEDVKQALGPHAKAIPLAATKRLLLIDSVANLRMVSALLNAERLESEGRVQPREFVLTHVQASEVIDIIYVVLGLDPSSRPSQMELQMQQQKMQLMMKLADRGKDVARMLQPDGPPVYLAYNRQRNSVLANAPAEQMRIIERTIKALDVPTGAGGGTDTAAEASPRVLEQYRLKTMDPAALVSTLEEIGNLSPRAELRADGSSKTLFARASARDHEKIAELIEQLDGSDTVVEVFWLRRLPAEAVAGSIQALIIEKPKKDDDNNNYPFYISFRNRNQEPKPTETELRVDADTENNRLIVRGTPEQLEEVRDLLAKLGEPVGEGADSRRVRVFDALEPEQTRRLLRQLESAWSDVGGGTELVLPPEPEPETPPHDDQDGDETPEEPADAPAPSRTASHSDESPFRLLAAKEGAIAAGDGRPPVRVRIDGAGRVVLSSDDTAALDRLEDLMADLAPPPKRYEVFQVTNRSPDDIVDQLRVYFEDFLAQDDDQILDWWGRLRGVKSEDEPIRLSRRRPLRFLSDDWSSTILVANATPDQLAEIGRLVKAWDRQPIDDRVITRRTTTVKLRYAKASSVVEAVKAVYREMLGRGDREFDTQERKASASSTRYLTQIRYGGGSTTEPAFIGFDGLLSLGSDDAANIVIVSAREEVFDGVVDAIRNLDEQARPTTTVRVRSIDGSVAMDEVRTALLRALSANNNTGGGRPNDRDRDRRRRGRGR